MQSIRKATQRTGKIHQLVIENQQLVERLKNANVDLSDSVFNQVSPNAVELEGIVLGACLIDKDAFRIVNEILNPLDFYEEKNQTLFSVMREMSEKPIAIDLATVAQFLRDKKLTDDIGGSYYLIELTNRVGSAANLEHHARIVFQKAQSRRLIVACTNAIRDAYASETDIFDLYDMLNEQTRVSNPKSLLRVQTMNAALTEGKSQPVRKQLVGTLLRENDMCVLFGDAGTGKSLLAIQIAEAIAKGKCLFGDEKNFKNECEPKKTLFFDFELETAELFDRYSESGLAYDFGENFQRVDMNPDNFDFSEGDDKLIRTVQQIIEKNQPEFIVIDNITWLTSEAQDTAIAGNFMKLFLRLQKRLGFTMIVIAHTPKRNTSEQIESKHLAGSRQIVNYAKNVIAVSPSKLGAGIVYLKHLKMRNGEMIFNADNVLQCCIEKPQGSAFLQWRVMAQTSEELHLATTLIEMTDDEIATHAIDLRKNRNMTWDEILTELSLPFTRFTLKRKVEKYEERNAERLKNTAEFEAELKS